MYRGLAKTGVVGTFTKRQFNGRLKRADLDTPPMAEHNTFDHRSRMTAKCMPAVADGHHRCCWAARYLPKTRNLRSALLFFNRLKKASAVPKAMIADGLFEQFPMEAVYGMHNSPGLPVGQFASARTDDGRRCVFDIHITGKGSHGARPEASVDPVVIAAQLTTLQTIVSRNSNPNDTVVLSVTRLRAGDAYNVIPQDAQLGETVRVFQSHHHAAG